MAKSDDEEAHNLGSELRLDLELSELMFFRFVGGLGLMEGRFQYDELQEKLCD